MFPKAALTFLVVGVLSVNALTTPLARSPAPEPESQELEAWMLKRDLSYELLSRELQALDELFSREPEDWAEWAGYARSHYTAKREPFPGNIVSTPDPKPKPAPTLPETSTYFSFPSPKPNPGTGVISTITSYFKKS